MCNGCRRCLTVTPQQLLSGSVQARKYIKDLHEKNTLLEKQLKAALENIPAAEEKTSYSAEDPLKVPTVQTNDDAAPQPEDIITRELFPDDTATKPTPLEAVLDEKKISKADDGLKIVSPNDWVPDHQVRQACHPRQRLGLHEKSFAALARRGLWIFPLTRSSP